MLQSTKLFIKILKILEIKKKNLFFLLLLCLISGVIDVFCSIVLKPLIDKSLISENSINYKYLKLFLLLMFFSILFTFIRKFFFHIINSNLDRRLNYRITKAISEIRMDYFDMKKEGEIVSILTKRIPELKSFFNEAFEKIIFTPIKFLFTMIGILSIDYKLGVIIIPGVLISVFIDFKYSNNIITSSKEAFKIEDELLAYQKEIIENIENIKMEGNENYIYEKYTEKSKKWIMKVDLMLRDYGVAYIPGLLNEYLPTILLLFIVSLKVSENKISYGVFLSSLSLVAGASLPFSHFLRIMTRLKGQKEKINELEKLFEIKDKIKTKKENIEVKSIDKIVVLKNISYTYKDKKNVILKNVNMEISENEKVAIIGETGSGKSTLLKIILGLYSPLEGTVKVFNKNPDENKKEIWNRIGYLDNNIYLFNGTIEYNITLLERELTLNEKQKLKEIAESLDMKELLESRIDLRQFGNNISGGQRLKISIARALFKNSELLVLDEPSASLDKDSEKILCRVLSKSKVTTLIITHRTEILDICDKIYEITNSNVVIEVNKKSEREV